MDVRKAAICLLLLFVSCREKDPIAHLIGEVTDAAEKRDASAVIEHLSSTYSDANGGRRDVELALKRYFFAYKSIDITVQQLETSHSASAGQASFRVLFLSAPKSIGGMDQFLPRSASYLFDVWLVKEKGDWKIATAQWREAGSP
jgi:hypothetical protein